MAVALAHDALHQRVRRSVVLMDRPQADDDVAQPIEATHVIQLQLAARHEPAAPVNLPDILLCQLRRQLARRTRIPLIARVAL